MKVATAYFVLLLSLVAFASASFTTASAPPTGPGTPLCWKAAVVARPIWQGVDGWLFGRRDLLERIDPGVPVRADLERFVTALEAQGVTLVAVVLPTRGSVYSDKLGGRAASYNGARARASYRRLLADLRAAGVLAPDLTRVTRRGSNGFFFRRDGHWTSAGARRAAGAVASLVRPLPSYAELTKSSFRTRSLGQVAQKGFLQGRAERLCDVSLPDERLEVFTTDMETAALSPEEALFADLGPPPVTLVGTSNSKRLPDRPDLNFSGFLRERLGLEVLNAAFSGAGVYGSLLAYLRSDDFRAHKPSFIVWETLVGDWHSRPDLEDEHRQVIPSVYGACAPEEALLRARTEARGRENFTLLQSDGLPLRGRSYFIYLELQDRTLVNFSLTLRYRGAQQETVRLVHATRVPNPGRFFLELSGEAGDLVSVSLNAPHPVTGTVRARVCRVPSDQR